MDVTFLGCDDVENNLQIINYMKMIQTAFKFQFSIKKFVFDNNDFALNLVQLSSNVVTIVNK